MSEVQATSKPGRSGPGWLRVTLLWLSGLLILFLLVRSISPGDVGRTLLDINVGLLGWAALFAGLATLVGAFNSYLLLTARRETPFRGYLVYFWIAWAFGLVLPGQVGDVGVLSWAMRSRGFRLTHSLGRLFLDKLVSLAVIGGIALYGLLDVLGQLDIAFDRLWWLLALAALACAALYIGWHIPLARTWLQHGIAVVLEAVDTARSFPRRLLVNLVLTVAKILIQAFSFWLVCLSVGLQDLHFLLLLKLMAIGSIVAYLPVSMNGVGTVELVAVAVFSLYGYSSAGVLSAYLASRLLFLSLAWIPTFLFILWRAHEKALSTN